MDKNQKKQRAEAARKKLDKNRLLSFLRAFPAATLRQQAEYLNVSEATIKNYHNQLKAEGRAVNNTIVPVGAVHASHKRHYVFILTTYQTGLEESMKMGLENPQEYQIWVAAEIQERLRKHFSKTLISGGVDILLGCDWDMKLTVDADHSHMEDVHDLVTKHIRTCPHVLRTSTATARSTAEYPGILAGNAQESDAYGDETDFEETPESENFTAET